MSRHKLPALLVALLLVLLTSGAAANSSTDWESGRAAFASGQYDAALSYFEAARDSGLGGPAVHYNIAVCQYSLRDYFAARGTFQLIAQRFPTMQGLAEYNVGLSERRLGNLDAAQRQFVSAYRHSGDEKIKALAASQLTELEREQRSAWYGLVGVQVGHDDNVALRDSLGLPAGVSAESPLADLFASLRGPLAGVGGLELDGSLYAVSYPDADEYDQVEIRIGALYTFDRGDWRLRGGIYGAAGTLGGSSFNREASLDLRSIRYLGEDATFELRLRHDEIKSAQALFDGIEGSRSRLELGYRWHSVVQSLALRLGVEENDRLDSGVSPSRQQIQADYYYQISDSWGLESAAAYRSSDFDDVALPRTEDLLSLAVGVVYLTESNWRFSGRYQYSTNDSTDPMYSYDRNQLTVGFQRLF